MTLAEHDELDAAIRQQLRLAEAMAALLKEEPLDLINKGVMLQTIQSDAVQPPPARNGVNKKAKRSASERERSDRDKELDAMILNSPGPTTSPNEPRDRSERDPLRKVKSGVKRDSSVASSSRAGVSSRNTDDSETIRSNGAENKGAGLMSAGTEVFFRHQKGSFNVEGEGIQATISKVFTDRRP